MQGTGNVAEESGLLKLGSSQEHHQAERCEIELGTAVGRKTTIRRPRYGHLDQEDSALAEIKQPPVDDQCRLEASGGIRLERNFGLVSLLPGKCWKSLAKRLPKTKKPTRAKMYLFTTKQVTPVHAYCKNDPQSLSYCLPR